MARVRKQAAYIEKKNQIVMKSIALLDEIGYEQFSINKVITHAGMTKGAFFHYFSSKSELIGEIIDLLKRPLAEALGVIANDKTLSPKQKILNMADSIQEVKGAHQQTAMQLTRLLQRAENKSIANMVEEESIELFLPIYEKVLVEGNKCGQFNIAYPNGSAFIYFSALAAIKREIGAVMNHEIKDKDRRLKLKEKVKAFEAYANSLFNFDEDIKIIDVRVLDEIEKQN